jgi:hypothetical protein
MGPTGVGPFLLSGPSEDDGHMMGITWSVSGGYGPRRDISRTEVATFGG